MAKFEWSETFMSIEGEAKYAGHPTVYARFVKCNFQCQGFNNPSKEDTTSVETLGFNPADYDSIHKIPVIQKGCDSIYSWDPKFKHMWETGTEDDLVKSLLMDLPHGKWLHPLTDQPVIFSLTGGEPTLRAKFLPALLNHPKMADCRHILIETNCAVPLKFDFIGAINEWLCADLRRKWTWSNSPKLSVSGEKWEDAIIPDIAMRQRMVTGREGYNQVDQYFKFVCGPNEEDFQEVAQAMEEYYARGIPRTVEVYIMPVACTEEQQLDISSRVARMCMEHGYIYSHRIQNSVFGNGVGT